MEDTDLLEVMGTDAAKWAAEFVKLHGGDEGLMLGWFANAIESARGDYCEGVSEGVKAGRMEGVGWAWSEACSRLDRGEDPRSVDIAGLVPKAASELSA